MNLCNWRGHKWKMSERSNVIQYDNMGYPLRLCIYKCERCGASQQLWVDTVVEEGDKELVWTPPCAGE